MRKSTDFWLIIFIIFLMFFPRIAGYLLVSNSIKNDKSHKIEERIFKEFEKEFDNELDENVENVIKIGKKLENVENFNAASIIIQDFLLESSNSYLEESSVEEILYIYPDATKEIRKTLSNKNSYILDDFESYNMNQIQDTVYISDIVDGEFGDQYVVISYSKKLFIALNIENLKKLDVFYRYEVRNKNDLNYFFSGNKLIEAGLFEDSGHLNAPYFINSKNDQNIDSRLLIGRSSKYNISLYGLKIGYTNKDAVFYDRTDVFCFISIFFILFSFSALSSKEENSENVKSPHPLAVFFPMIFVCLQWLI